MPLTRPHFTSPEAMNWSITTCAPLAKSPNWASQITQRVRVVRGVAVFEGQHRLFRQDGVDHDEGRLVVGHVLQRRCRVPSSNFSRFWSCSTAWRVREGAAAAESSPDRRTG